MAIDINSSRGRLLQKNKKEELEITGVTLDLTLSQTERMENMRRLWRYRAMWDAMEGFRRRRRRAKMYYHGDQWNDKIEVYKKGCIEDKEFITEAENIRRQGKIPLKNNMIVSTVASVLGVIRQNYGKPEVISRTRDNQKIGEMNTCMAEYLYQINSMKELDARGALEAMLGGLVLHMPDFKWNRATKRCEVSVVDWNPTRAFMNGGIEDPRGNDIRTIGVIMDMTREEAKRSFAKNKTDAQKIDAIYNLCTEQYINDIYRTFTYPTTEGLDFFIPKDKNMCRVIQAWEQESEEAWMVHDYYDGTVEIYPFSDGEEIDKMIAERAKEIRDLGLDEDECKIEKEYFTDIYWKVRYLSPRGDVLFEAKTPFVHDSHPFAVYMGHLIDGEIHSFVEQIIDQQRYINRLITLIDFIMGASAKGVLVFPENALPKDMNKEDILEEWTSYNGVIFANLKPGMPLPQQIATNATNIGAQEMLALQMQLMRDISGVHGALQGKEAKSGTAASLYAQEASNAQVNIADFLEGFTAFRQQRDYKMIKIAPQCYDEEFYINLSGREYSEEAKMWRPEVAGSADIYVNLEENNNSAVYRMQANQILIKAMEMRMIDFETVLDAGGIPNADKILTAIERRKKQLQEEQARQQAMQMQGQAIGTQLAEAGASPGQIQQISAETAKAALQQEAEGGVPQEGANPQAMALIQEALAA